MCIGFLSVCLFTSCLFLVLLVFFFLIIRRPPRSTRTDTLFPYTTLFRSVDVAERVVAGRAAFPVRRVEQDNLLAAFAAETRRDFVVLTLNIEHDNRIRPLQQIGNDDADALARSGRGFEQYMLHLTHPEKAEFGRASGRERVCQ